MVDKIFKISMTLKIIGWITVIPLLSSLTTFLIIRTKK